MRAEIAVATVGYYIWIARLAALWLMESDEQRHPGYSERRQLEAEVRRLRRERHPLSAGRSGSDSARRHSAGHA